MIVCPRCAKENQDHYKFCLGCGAELPRDAEQQPKSFTAPTPPAGFPKEDAGTAAGPGVPAAPASPPGAAQFGGAAAASQPAFGGAQVAPAGGAAPAEPSPAAAPAAPAAAAADGGMLSCPKCSNSVPPNFKFCGSCGHPMADVQAAAAAASNGAGAAAPAEAAPAAPAADATPGRGALVLIRPDGSEGDSFQLADGTTTLGRDSAPLFASDSYLSPTHASFTFSGADLEVKDEDSLNGIYVRVDADVPVELSGGSIFRIGQEILRFESIERTPADGDGVELMGSPDPGYLGRIRLVIGRETYGNSYCVPPEGMHLGRERGDIIFPDDGYVSGLHCRIHGEGGKMFLTDVGSSNGTFIRVEGAHTLRSGSMVLMGQQLFRVEY